MSALEPILVSTRAEVARRKRSGAPRAGGRGEARSFRDALAAPGLSLIAEHKRRSPSAGLIRSDLSVTEVAGAYERAGASALSILTEGPNFGGTLEDLAEARRASSLPMLRKDFIVDEFQVAESVSAGADAILLIVAALWRRSCDRCTRRRSTPR